MVRACASVCLCVSVLAGCLVDAGDELRTYPDAFDLPFVSLKALKEEVAVPDSFNIAVYVTAVHECPSNANCFVADHIMVAEMPNPEFHEDVLTMSPRKPSQFDVGARYVMSVYAWESRVVDAETGKRRRILELLGYDDPG